MHTPNDLRKVRPAVKLALLPLLALLLQGCGSKSAPPPQAPAAATDSASETSNAANAIPAPAVTESSWTPDELQKLVAPIALYPDQLVGQILAASVNSQEVLDGGNWLLQNQSLSGDALDTASQQAGLGPAMQALVHFPTVVDMMCQQLDWTRQLGAAFTSDQKAVLDAVQDLRAQAAQVGNLKSTPQQTVVSTTANNKTIIEVKPADPQIVYVPQYNPQVIYTTPPSPPPQPVAASSAGTVSTEAAVVGGLLAFGVGIAVGNAMHQDNYCYPHWGAGAVYVGQRPFYPPAYVYRPVYGPGYRPAGGYAPPPNYRYGYRNTNVNGNVNININNNNYFNQFNNNENLRNVTNNNLSGATRTTANNNLSGATHNAPSSNGNWKGQSTYAGARGNPQGQRMNQTPSRPYDSDQRLGAGGTRNPALADSSKAAAARTTTASVNGRSQSLPGSSRDQANAAGRGNNPSGSTREAAVDRGFGGSSRGAGDLGAASAAGPRQTALSGLGGGADSPAGNGAFARASSARGHASTGGFNGGARGRSAR
jgi:hypothetical protein